MILTYIMIIADILVDTLYFTYLLISNFFLYVLSALSDCKLSAGGKQILNMVPDIDVQ